MGIGFAIPSNMAKGVMDSLIKHGKVVRGFLGVTIQDVNEKISKQFGLKDAKGALVSDVVSGSPADKGGIQSGDVILSFDGKTVENSTALRHRVADTPVDKTVAVEVMRDKKPVKLNVKVVEQPKDMTARGAPVKSGEPDTVLAGLEVRTLTPEDARQLNLGKQSQGVVVIDVESGSAVEEAGIRPGDVIVELNRKPVRHVDDFRKLSGKLGKNDTALLLVVRQGSKLFLAVNP